MKSITVLVTGAGSPGFPGVVQSLRFVSEYDIRIIATDMNEEATGRFFADSFFLVPQASSQLFIEELLIICERERVDVLLPMVSAELPILANHQEDFARVGTKVSVSNSECITQVQNKGILYHMVRHAGLIVPNYTVVRTVQELEKAIGEMGYPQKAVCFKPIISDGSRGFRILDPSINRMKLLFFEKPNSTYISYSELFTILDKLPNIPELLVMEYLPGEEYSVDILADRGSVIVAIPRLRVATVNGITSRGALVREDDVIDYVSTIVHRFGLHGNIGVQVRRDDAKIPKLIEVNPRIQGTIVLCTAGGVNLPFLAVKLAMGIPIESIEYQVQWGMRMNRYWKEVFFDIQGVQHPLS